MKTVLMVDDEAEARRMVSIMLKREDLKIETAEYADEALRKALAAPPDLVILDVMMPDVDGYQLCRVFRDNPKLSRVPILILTARAQAVADRVGLVVELGIAGKARELHVEVGVGLLQRGDAEVGAFPLALVEDRAVPG